MTHCFLKSTVETEQLFVNKAKNGLSCQIVVVVFLVFELNVYNRKNRKKHDV